MHEVANIVKSRVQWSLEWIEKYIKVNNNIDSTGPSNLRSNLNKSLLSQVTSTAQHVVICVDLNGHGPDSTSTAGWQIRSNHWTWHSLSRNLRGVTIFSTCWPARKMVVSCMMFPAMMLKEPPIIDWSRRNSRFPPNVGLQLRTATDRWEARILKASNKILERHPSSLTRQQPQIYSPIKWRKSSLPNRINRLLWKQLHVKLEATQFFHGVANRTASLRKWGSAFTIVLISAIGAELCNFISCQYGKTNQISGLRPPFLLPKWG